MSSMFWKPGTEKPGAQLGEERSEVAPAVYNANTYVVQI